MKRIILLAVFCCALAMVSAAVFSQQQQAVVVVQKPVLECSSDNDCFKGGCSGQVCSTNQHLITTCEWISYYACFNMTSCGCVDGKCQWESNQNFDSCMAQAAPKLR
jgi:eight-cysteine-cluster-containing protein